MVTSHAFKAMANTDRKKLLKLFLLSLPKADKWGEKMHPKTLF